MLKQLKVKFVVVTMSVACAMLIIIFGLVYHFTRMNLESQCADTLNAVHEMATQPGILEQREDVLLPYFYLQINVFGDVFATGSPQFDLENEHYLQTLIQEVYERNVTSGFLEDQNLRYQFSYVLGSRYISFVDISGQEATLTALVKTSMLIGFLSMGLLLVISILLARWAVKPVEKALHQQQQFVSDASHELKTPLTVIMSNVELLDAQEYDEESKKQFIGSIKTMSVQMRALVEGLLELARADNGQVKKSFAQIDMSSLTQETVLPFEPVFFENGLQLEITVEPGIRLMGSERYLRQVIEILLDNARKYSAPGIVSLELIRQGKNCLLRVSNPGEPIPKSDLEKIFERFYRTDEARTRTGSFGLGLSIARSIVQEHGGRIWAQSNQSGNRFNVQLPAI